MRTTAEKKPDNQLIFVFGTRYTFVVDIVVGRRQIVVPAARRDRGAL